MNKLTLFYSPLSKAASFVIDGITLDSVKVVPLIIRENLISKILSKLFCFLGFNRLAIYFRYQKDSYQNLISKHHNVLFWDSCPLYIYTIIAKIVICENKNIFFWNPLLLHSKNVKIVDSHIKRLKAYYNLCTFDPNDSSCFGINLVKNVNRNIELNKSIIDTDFYFLGLPKGRENELSILKNTLINKGFTVKFIVPHTKEEYISQMENIQNSANCRCIVDVVSEKYQQSGMTLRPFDAMFLKKKLLSNCELIRKTDFYNEYNVFIFSDPNNLDGIEEFMQLPYHDIDSELLDQYEINNWLMKFITK